MEYVATTEAGEIPITIAEGDRKVWVNSCEHQVDLQDDGNHAVVSLLVDNHSYAVSIESTGDVFRIVVAGRVYPIRVATRLRQQLAAAAGQQRIVPEDMQIRAPMPGLVVSVAVQPGQAVSSHDLLLVLESMKMQNEVRASEAGLVREVRALAGQMVDGGQVLMVIGREEGETLPI